MHSENGFELLIAVVFSVIPQLGGLGPKDQDIVIPFWLGEVESLPDFHLRDLGIRSEILFMRDQRFQINNLTGKYIMELSKLKHIQRYMISFDLDFRRFECQP